MEIKINEFIGLQDCLVATIDLSVFFLLVEYNLEIVSLIDGLRNKSTLTIVVIANNHIVVSNFICLNLHFV